MSRPSRKGYEFSDRVKDEETTRWHSKNPGREDEKVEIHHILPISEAKKRDVPKEAVRSQQNAVGVSQEFHKEIHEKMDQETYDALAEALKKLWLVLPIGGIVGLIAYLAN